MQGVLDKLESHRPKKIEKRSIENHGTGRLSEWREDIELKESSRCGLGLFAKKDLPKGTLVWEQDEKKVNKIPLKQFWSFPSETRSK